MNLELHSIERLPVAGHYAVSLSRGKSARRTFEFTVEGDKPSVVVWPAEFATFVNRQVAAYESLMAAIQAFHFAATHALHHHDQQRQE